MKKIFHFILLSFFFLANALSQTSDSIAILQQLESNPLSSEKDIENYTIIIENKLPPKLSFEKKLYYTHKGLKAAQSINDSLSSAYISHLFTLHYYFGQADSILHYAKHYSEIGKKLDNLDVLGGSETYLGLAHKNRGNLHLAINHFYRSFEYYNKSIYPVKVLYPLNNISRIFMDMGDDSSALTYLKLSIEAGKHFGVPRKYYVRASNYIPLAKLYQEQHQVDSAHYYFQKGIENVQLIDTLDIPRYRSRAYYSYLYYAQFLLEQNKIDQAKIYLDKSIPLRHDNSLFFIKTKIAYCLKTKNCKDLDMLFDTLESKVSKDSTKLDTYFYTVKKDYHLSKGDYQKALEAEQKKTKLEKELFDQKRTNYIDYMNAQFEHTQKEQEIASLEIESQLKTTKNISLSFGLLLSIFLLGIGGILFFQIRKKNQLLSKDLEHKKTIEQQAQRLKELNQFKNKLFNNISHELRTPLSIIIGVLEPLEKEKNFNVALAKRNSEQLLQMVNQILDISKINNNEIKPTIYQCELSDFMHSIFIEYEGLAKMKNINLNKSFPNSLITIKTDLPKLKIIIGNLLSNAMKYTLSNGQIMVQYVIRNNQLQFSIQDNGQGIPKEDIPHIFDQFFQSQTNSGINGGIGIGLAICKEYVELLEGQIEVESTFGKGSTFSFQIPIKHSSSAEHPLIYPISTTPALEENFLPKKEVLEDYTEYNYILIVEDNMDMCLYLFNALREDYHLAFAHDGHEALQFLDKKQPSIIVSDWMMPNMDGKELIETIKNKENHASIPTLMLTARHEPKDKIDALLMGVNNYLQKPFQISELKTHINNLLTLAENINEEKNRLIDETNNSSVTKNSYSAQDRALFKLLEDLIKENLNNFDFNLEDILPDMGISYSHLNRKTKSLIGLTPKKYIQEVRLQEAKRMLENQEYNTVKAVAYSTGFKDLKRFSRSFYKRFGKYPSSFLN